MNLYDCQRWAETSGFNSAEFYADFPAGRKKCKWLDAYFGCFTVEGMDPNTMLLVQSVIQQLPNLVCEPIEVEE